jgi:hypothetical protein
VTVEEYADALNLELMIIRHANQFNRYVARFHNTETKENFQSCILSSTHGNGSSADGAVRDYAEKIRGKVLVVDASDKLNRREYAVPRELTA